ncbi:MAG: hypothetical protein ASARMPREDX12_004046 [Alectoria sarmentosa]|nr:MAG: hypothetical protein ASARMPREDX12_004046 [Alectoria sarmentosa]
MADAVAPVGHTNGTTFVWNTKGQVIAAAALLPSLGIVLVGLRFYVRIKTKAGLGADDWLTVPALPWGVFIGVGENVIAHTTAPDPDSSPEAQLYQISPAQELLEKIYFIFYTLMIPAYGLIKLSVIFFYRRLFVKGTNSRFDSITKASIVIVILWTIAFFFAHVFACGVYISNTWGPLTDLKHCANGDVIANGLFISDFLSDLLVLVLPMPIIARLHMSTTRKLNVIAVLMLGTMSFCASIVRMVFNFQITAAGLAKKTDVDGSLEVLTTLLYWSMIEAGLSLIASCLPSIHVIFASSSLPSIIARVRSAISLHSIHSNGSRSSKKSYENMDTSSKTSHEQPLKQQVDSSSHIYATYEMDDAPPLPPPDGAIFVQSDLSQCEILV